MTCFNVILNFTHAISYIEDNENSIQHKNVAHVFIQCMILCFKLSNHNLLP